MSALVPRERIEQTILLIRGHRVMLSTVLADLYAVEPRVLIQAVKRNRDRFPTDFMFQLTEQEFDHLKSQIVISSWGGLRRAYPYAFTEQGVAMLSSVFRNERARAPIGHGTMPHWYRSTRSDIHCSERLAYGG
ncbi:MAG: DNA-binding protein [Nitrospira sp.]|nr:MAG: DNA-binding protein [Nitrospira sp.]